MDKNSKIFIAGHKGLVGGAIHRRLLSEGYNNIIVRTRQELDLLSQTQVADFFKKENIEYVFLAAAKVGGIIANRDFPAEFIYENLQIQNNIIHNSYLNGVKKLLFMGSSCIYPKVCPQPIKEEYLLTGALEPTNEPYALAKISGIKMCQAYSRQYGVNFISTMPTSIYGPNDNFNLNCSHVIPALLRRFHEAKLNNLSEVIAWGTGTPLREFLFVDDLADAFIFLMNNYDSNEVINIGTGEEISIKELTEMIKEIVGFPGAINWDTTKPDGTMRKLIDSSKINKLGWKHKTSLKEGIKISYEWFLNNY